MLEQLDDSMFAELSHAYGSASDVPDRLRALASDDLEQAREALYELGAAIFHQGSYFDATAPAVPFLIELADAEIRARAEVLLFLADMSGAAGDAELAFQPYLFSSSPARPTYPHAVATIAAIAAGRATYLRALACDDGRARACAAKLLVDLGAPSDADTLAQALGRETDEHARVTLSFACARLGLALTPVNEPGLVADVVATLRVAIEPEPALPAIARLLRIAAPLARESVPYFDGDLTRFAALTLVQRFAADPRAFDLAADALHDRLARGERIQSLPGGFVARIGDEPNPETTTSFSDYFADVPLRTIAGAMASLAFGERARDPALLRREQLDDRMRRVLALTVEHAIPVPVAGAPWIEASAMARFLTGGGPLDREVEWGGESQPLYVTLGALTCGDDPNAHEAEVEQLFAALADTWTPAELVELAIDILANSYELAPYGPPQPPIRPAIAKHITPLVEQFPDRLTAYAEELLTNERRTAAQVEFAFAPTIAAGLPVEPRFDRLAAQVIAADMQRGRDWLLCFPEPRRSQIVAGYGNGYLYNRFAADCERETLDDALIAAFLDPGCRWFEHEVDGLIATIPADKLAALREQTSGRRRAIVDRVLARG